VAKRDQRRGHLCPPPCLDRSRGRLANVGEDGAEGRRGGGGATCTTRVDAIVVKALIMSLDSIELVIAALVGGAEHRVREVSGVEKGRHRGHCEVVADGATGGGRSGCALVVDGRRPMVCVQVRGAVVVCVCVVCSGWVRVVARWVVFDVCGVGCEAGLRWSGSFEGSEAKRRDEWKGTRTQSHSPGANLARRPPAYGHQLGH
jgi:hypothetical protein